MSLYRKQALKIKMKQEFQSARSKGRCVGFNWLYTTARRTKKELDGGTIGKHIVRSFIIKNNIKMRRIQSNKKKSKEIHRETIMKWHATMREKLIRTVASEEYSEKWGRFLPIQRLNVDQSPLPL